HILISIISFLIIILLPLPYIFNVFDIYYLMIILIIIEPVFIYLTFIFLKNKSYEKKLYKRGSNLLKVIMLIGLIAFIVG
ncbi:MAG: digeranylgeranylglyceryl phosphate synthase, partial [Calditrichia bacterium]|nr:digeranylgeranylglyceryl phosphate synthase [Calditrichia bacterium]